MISCSRLVKYSGTFLCRILNLTFLIPEIESAGEEVGGPLLDLGQYQRQGKLPIRKFDDPTSMLTRGLVLDEIDFREKEGRKSPQKVAYIGGAIPNGERKCMHIP